jgi:membrane protein required for colicin V production
VLSPYIDNPTVAMIAFAAGVFLVTLIIVSLITFRISDRVLDSRVGALDRTFGFLFGLARGFLLVAIVFILFSALARDQPAWIVEARSYPILKQTQVAIESLIPANPEQYLPTKPEKPEGQPESPSDAPPPATPPDQHSEGEKSSNFAAREPASDSIEARLKAPI